MHHLDGGFRRIIRDCVIVGESSTYSAAAGAGNDMSSSAQPIFEIYPFFARTVDVTTDENKPVTQRHQAIAALESEMLTQEMADKADAPYKIGGPATHPGLRTTQGSLKIPYQNWTPIGGYKE
mgnify:CR=1 FL=1